MYQYMHRELRKLCAADMSEEDAAKSLANLQRLDRERPTAGQTARGAMAGAVGGLASKTMSSISSGDMKKGLSSSMAGRTGAKGKLMGAGAALLKGLHQGASAASGSAAFGATVPSVKRQLERGAEKGRLKAYAEGAPEGALRSSIKERLGE
jgi:hypothetical protein